MEISVKDYVRDKNGRVGKVFDITNEPSVDVGIGIIPEVNAVWIDKDKINYLYQEEITKHSKDIIDLIENEDEAIIEYINEFNKIITRRAFIDIKIDFIVFKTTYETLKYYIPTKEWFHFNSFDDFYKFKPTTNPVIKSILTHEQFEANAYKIEKEV